MYDALVTKLYDPSTSPLTHHANNKKTYGNVCMSSFYYLNDITSYIKTSKASNPASGHSSVMAHNGIYTHSNFQLYHSHHNNRNWYEAEFKQTVTISEVLVILRDSGLSHFVNVQFRVGNKTLDTSTPILFYSSGHPSNNQMIRAKFTTPATGLFLFMQENINNEYLLIGEIIVLGSV